MKFPQFCSLSPGPPCISTHGVLETDSVIWCWEIWEGAQRGWDVMQWTQVHWHEWCESGMFTIWLGREEAIWQGWILIGFSQFAPMYCSLCNGTHSSNNNSVFLLYNNTNRFIAPCLIPHVGAGGVAYPCCAKRVYIQGPECWNNKPPSLALSLIWWMETGGGGGGRRWGRWKKGLMMRKSAKHSVGWERRKQRSCRWEGGWTWWED